MNGRARQRFIRMYWEHDWTADGPVSRTARRDWQNRLAASLEGYVDGLQADATDALGSLIQAPAGLSRFFVFNPLSWARTDSADLLSVPTGSFHVVDVSSGQEVPSQIVQIDGASRLRILAQDVPPVGYKVYEVVPGPGQNFPDAAMVNTRTIENAAYRITLEERGAMISLVDKIRANREFVSMIDVRDERPWSGGGSLQAENVGPVSVTCAEATGPLAHTAYHIDPQFRSSNPQRDQQNTGTFMPWAFSFELETRMSGTRKSGDHPGQTAPQGGHYSPATDDRLAYLIISRYEQWLSGSPYER
jgi:alpha-mannosidase